MNKLIFIVLLFLTNSFSAASQCVDSNRIDLYFQCFDGFNPVCGCNGINYRNQCAADHWGGVNNYQSGVCDNFEIDFLPNPVVNGPGTVAVFVKNPSPVTIQIYDLYGKIMYTSSYNTSFTNQMIGPLNIDFSSFEIGIYCLAVTVAGELKSKKLLRVIE